MAFSGSVARRSETRGLWLGRGIWALDAYFPKDLDFPDELIPPLATAIGGVVLSWGMAESGLNATLVMCFSKLGGRHHSDEIPVSLKRKLKFLRLCLRTIAALEPYRTDGLALFAITGQLAKSRNDLIHGFISDFDPKTGLFTFTNTGSEKAVALIKGQPKYSISDIRNIGSDCMTHSVALANFAQRLVQAFLT